MQDQETAGALVGAYTAAVLVPEYAAQYIATLDLDAQAEILEVLDALRAQGRGHESFQDGFQTPTGRLYIARGTTNTYVTFLYEQEAIVVVRADVTSTLSAAPEPAHT